MEEQREYCGDTDSRFNRITNNALAMGEIDLFTLHGKYD